jgi:hypothetical protein
VKGAPGRSGRGRPEGLEGARDTANLYDRAPGGKQSSQTSERKGRGIMAKGKGAQKREVKKPKKGTAKGSKKQ